MNKYKSVIVPVFLFPRARAYCHHGVVTITLESRNSHAYNSTWLGTLRITSWTTALSKFDVWSYSQCVIGSGFELTSILPTNPSKTAPNSLVNSARKRRLNEILIYSEKRGNLLTDGYHFFPWTHQPHSNHSSYWRIEGHVGKYHPQIVRLISNPTWADDCHPLPFHISSRLQIAL